MVRPVAAVLLPASMAGLPAAGSMVRVGPVLLARLPRLGLAVLTTVPEKPVAKRIRLPTPEVASVPTPLILATKSVIALVAPPMIVLLIAAVAVALSA